MRKVVFDIETTNFFTDTGTNDPASLSLACVCIYDSETDTYQHFFEEDLKQLWPILERTDLLIGFNSDHFDLPILNKYYSGDLTKIKSIDIMKEIKKKIGRRIGLNAVAEATLGKKKSGDGANANIWWRRGERQRVVDYCMDDVCLTKELYDFALTNGFIRYREGGNMRELTLETTDWEAPTDVAMTHTLPF
jgi:DEAD/DEAH box helicase domain-containing protein